MGVGWEWRGLGLPATSVRIKLETGQGHISGPHTKAGPPLEWTSLGMSVLALLALCGHLGKAQSEVLLVVSRKVFGFLVDFFLSGSSVEVQLKDHPFYPA